MSYVSLWVGGIDDIIKHSANRAAMILLGLPWLPDEQAKNWQGTRQIIRWLRLRQRSSGLLPARRTGSLTSVASAHMRHQVQ